MHQPLKLLPACEGKWGGRGRVHLTLRGSNVHSQRASAGMPAGAFVHGPCEFPRDGFKEQKVKPTAVHTYLSFPYIKAYNRIGKSPGQDENAGPGPEAGKSITSTLRPTTQVVVER